MNITIAPSWKEQLQEEFSKPYFKEIQQQVTNAYATQTCYPPKNEIFAAFNYTDFEEVKVVILGQDPYHNYNEANGLCFSVNDSVKIPPSLKNILQEVAADFNIKRQESGNLEHWAKQGVLLLNSTLTVQENKPGSHKKFGWERFTDAAIHKLSKEREGLVFMLWGNHAKKKSSLIDAKKHKVIESIHPSPLSVNRNREGWEGQKQFSRANSYLLEKGIKPILW